MLLDGLTVILVATRFPENIGMVARACANMGCPKVVLVDPEHFDFKKASPLATPKGLPLLEKITVTKTLDIALQHSTHAYGTTARTGGWRKEIYTPHAISPRIARQLQQGDKVALVFGPEDRGLNNQEIIHCHELITIPTDQASSLNLAQAVLIVLYEIAQAKRTTIKLPVHSSRTVSYAELDILLRTFKETLLKLDYLHGDNVDYFFQVWKSMFSRMELKQHEFSALMGLCRQINNKII